MVATPGRACPGRRCFGRWRGLGGRERCPRGHCIAQARVGDGAAAVELQAAQRRHQGAQLRQLHQVGALNSDAQPQGAQKNLGKSAGNAWNVS